MTKFIESGAAKLRIEEAATKKQVPFLGCYRATHLSAHDVLGVLLIGKARGTLASYASRASRLCAVAAARPDVDRISRFFCLRFQASIDSGKDRIVGVNSHRLEKEGGQYVGSPGLWHSLFKLFEPSCTRCSSCHGILVYGLWVTAPFATSNRETTIELKSCRSLVLFYFFVCVAFAPAAVVIGLSVLQANWRCVLWTTRP